MKKFSWSYFRKTVTDALRQGMTPGKLAATCALGIVISIIPIFGTTTLLCFGLALLFRLNIVIIQLANYLAAPLQLLLIFPFIKTGIRLFDLPPFAYTKEELILQLKNNPLTLLKESGLSMVSGMGVWLLVAIPLFFILYYATLSIVRKWRKAQGPELGKA
jgi:uncharacterized protein (DUF2062 family)